MATTTLIIAAIELECTCAHKPEDCDCGATCGCVNIARGLIEDCIEDDVSDKVRTMCTDGNGDCHVSIAGVDCKTEYIET